MLFGKYLTVCADVDALELVLSHGGTTKSADVHGGYAIHYAAQMCGTGLCRSGDARNIGVRVLQSLLSHGADVHVTDKHGRQPILWAASAGEYQNTLRILGAVLSKIIYSKTTTEKKKNNPSLIMRVISKRQQNNYTSAFNNNNNNTVRNNTN